MSNWDQYRSRIMQKGGSARNAVLLREQKFLNNKLPSHLSYHSAVVDRIDRDVAIINSDNYNIKTIISMPGEDLPLGGLVDWMDEHWLIIERDANNEVYTRAKMQQCNYLLRWVSDDGVIQERWSIIEDGTKYLTGEYGDNDFVLNRGDTRLALTVAKDAQTICLDRENRFLIDDYDSENVLAYRLTKPFKLGGTFNGVGVLRFVLQECNTEDTDNFELHIANYYKYFPRESDIADPDNKPIEPEKKQPNGKKVWI